MDEINKIRVKSRNLSKIIIVEFAYCALLYFVYKVYIIQSDLTSWIYLGLLIVLPLVFNLYLYLKNKKNSDWLEANNLIIVQILILMFSFKFLVQ
jgi:hypothetical protein